MITSLNEEPLSMAGTNNLDVKPQNTDGTYREIQ